MEVHLKKMSTGTKYIIIIIFRILDIILIPLTFLASVWFKYIRKVNVNRMYFSKMIFNKIGILPIHDHYYEPLVNPDKHLNKNFSSKRKLPGIFFNDKIQLSLLNQFHFQEELIEIPENAPKDDNWGFFHNNNSFESGDCEYLYSIIRLFKPKKMIEIGSGFSTRISLLAFEKNKSEDQSFTYDLTCIEPYEFHLISNLNVNHVKQKVENIDVNYFTSLNKNDILFIDSSHIIRPDGDVLHEFLNILPSLKSGVLIHIHDIFTPNHYPYSWIKNHILWNEQYLLEAFLTDNDNYEIIGALNYLKHNYWKEIALKFPILANNKSAEPGSFWIRKK